MAFRNRGKSVETASFLARVLRGATNGVRHAALGCHYVGILHGKVFEARNWSGLKRLFPDSEVILKVQGSRLFEKVEIRRQPKGHTWTGVVRHDGLTSRTWFVKDSDGNSVECPDLDRVVEIIKSEYNAASLECDRI